MNERYENTPYIPERLRKITMEELAIDTVYLVRTDPGGDDYGLDDHATVWVDKTGGLRSDKSGKLTGDDRVAIDALNERVAVMKVLVSDEDGDPHIAYIADIRYLSPGLLDVVMQCEDDDCYCDDPSQGSDSEICFDAVISSDMHDEDDNDGQYVLGGDPMYYDALRYLADEVDQMTVVQVPETAPEQSGNMARKVQRALGVLAKKVLQRTV